MDRFRVVICGGGIAAVEGLLRLRRLAGERVDIALVAPGEELRIRPLAVQEPFSRPGVRRRPLRKVASDAKAEWVQDAIEWVDADGQVVHTAERRAIPFDALLLAVGGRAVVPYEHVTVFDDAHADETYHGLLQDVEDGYTRKVTLLLPEGPTWPLPIYELALMTAQRAYSVGIEGLEIDLVTPEPAPLAVFGEAASRAVAERLKRRRVRVFTGSTAELPSSRRVLVSPSGQELEPERVVALPRLEGPRIRDVPAVDGGFIPIDARCRVNGMSERVFAAGDATATPLKHGGVGAQQADVAAASIAAIAGFGDPPQPLRPVARGVLLTGERPLFVVARGEPDGGIASEVSEQPLWPEDEKVVAEELGPYLAKHA